MQYSKVSLALRVQAQHNGLVSSNSLKKNWIYARQTAGIFLACGFAAQANIRAARQRPPLKYSLAGR